MPFCSAGATGMSASSYSACDAALLLLQRTLDPGEGGGQAANKSRDHHDPKTT